MTILLVDDDRLVREMFADLLAEEGIAVTHAADGGEALEVLALQPAKIDMIVSDYEMPRLDGLQLYAKVRRIFPAIPFLLISGTSPGVPLAVEFMCKSEGPDAIVAKIRQMLLRKSRRSD